MAAPELVGSSSRGMLAEQRVKSVAGFSREMKCRSWPYRVIMAAEAGIWKLTVTRSPKILHRMLCVDGTVAVHILRDWICGNAYGKV